MFSGLKIKTKMMLALCSVILVMYGITIFLVMYNTNAIIKEEAFEKTNNMALQYSHIIKNRIEKAMQTARVLSETYEGIIINQETPNKSELDTALKQIMKQHPEFSGLWIMINPGELFKGHYYPWLHRDREQVEFAFEPYETIEEYQSETEQSFYAIPKQSQKEALLEPYAETGINIMMTSTVVPIIVNNRVAGVAGVDLTLEVLSQIVSEIKPYGTGMANLISNTGIYIAHPDKDMVNKPFEKNTPLLKKAANAIKNGEKFSMTEVSETLGEETYRIFVPIQIGDCDKPWAFSVEVPIQKILANGKRILWICLISGLIAILFAGGIIFLIALSITRPINQTVAGLKDIAQGEGDLTKRLSITAKDELGELASWFNVFIEKMQAIITQVSTNTNQMDNASRELSGIATELASQAERTSLRANNVAIASEELSSNVTTVAAAMEESTTNTSIVASSSEDMSTTFSQIAANVEEASIISGSAVTQAQETAKRMGELEEAAQSISKVTDAITDISDKTNLLALNATIEAARAGEAGKGFAVVATEIKELAAQTIQATENIKNQISGIQNSSRVSISSIDKIVTIINQVNDIIKTITAAMEEQSTTTQEITTNITHTSQGLAEINENVNQGASISEKISGDIIQVSEAAEQISGKSSAVTEQAAQLEELSSVLKKIVTSFKI